MTRQPLLRSTTQVVAAAAAALLMAVASLAAAPPTGAEEGPPEVGLTWQMSGQAFTSSSMSPAHDTTPPAFKDDEGFVFPETSSVDFDLDTGAGTITYPGGYQLGNFAQGNYRIRLDTFTVDLTGTGTGTLSALVSYALAPPDEEEHAFTTPVEAIVATFTLPEGQPVVNGTNVSFTVTPDFVPRTDLDPNPNGWRQFPQPFLDALSASLRAHFQETGGGEAGQPVKAPAPLTVSFELPDPDEEFVLRAYDVVLSRDADEAGAAYWTSRIHGGTPRDAVANALAATSEGHNRLVAETYLRALDRPADGPGQAYWAGRLAGGLSAEDLVAQLLASSEALGRAGIGSVDAAELLYDLYLGRAGDAAGVSYWAGRLEAADSAGARRTIALGFGRTSEATTHGVDTAIDRACSATEVDPSARDTVTSRWTTSGHHPLRTAGTALAAICPFPLR